MSTSSDGTVVINGNVVNVAMKLALLKKAEAERDAAKTALTEQQSLVGKELKFWICNNSTSFRILKNF